MGTSLTVDLHIHSEASVDGVTSVDRILSKAEDIGLDGFCITDHNFFDPDRHERIVRSTDCLVVPGEEINTDQGHVLAYFIEEEIEPFRDASDVIEDIRRQGGLAVMAHPFRIRTNYPRDYFQQFDAVERFNARSGDPDDPDSPNHYTRDVLDHAGIRAVTAGSDSHVPWTIGNGITEFEDVRHLDEMKQAIVEGSVRTGGTPSYQFNRAISKAVFLSRNPSVSDWMNYVSDAARWIGRDCRTLMGF